MIKKMVIPQGDGNSVMLTNEVYEKFYRMVVLLGDDSKRNSWRNTFYLLVLLRNCFDIRIPYVIKKNYNFFSKDEIALLEALYSKINILTDAYIATGVLCELDEVNEIMNEFMSLYDTINYFFEFRLYIHKRNVLLQELQRCLSETDYMACHMKLVSAGENLPKLQEAVQECEALILEDWRKKLTNPSEYQEGAAYAFICHAGSPKPGRLVSASLLTNKIFATYGGSSVLFILDHNSMFNTEPSDCALNNFSFDSMLAHPNHLLTLLTKDTLEEETLKKQVQRGYECYNEVDLYEFRPIGIIIILEDENDLFRYNIGKEMQEKYPHLPLVYINRSLYKCQRV